MTFTKKVKYKFNCLAIFDILNRSMKKIIFILGLWLYLFSIKVNATVIFVDIIHIGGTQTGTSWATAFSDFQAGINAAHAGDSVWVARGTYQPAAVHASFSMKEGVKIFGGFQNTDLLFNERNWQNDSTILAGNQGHVIDNSMNHLTAASMIDGFIIKDGYADYGGGIYNISSSPTIVNVSLHTNMAKLRGGGMYNSNASPTLSNVIIYDNTADIMFGDGWGGGMCNENASPVLTDVRITGNLGYRGGGIYNEHSNPVLTNVVVKGNTVGNLTLGFGSGGGIYNESSSPTLTNVEITDNLGGLGGGICNINSSSPSLDNVIINDNIATHSGAGGGMYNSNGSSPTLTNVTINGNKALYQGNGGGMYNINNSSPILNYVTISNNMAGWSGGGMYNRNSAPVLNHVTITGDSARAGGGIANFISYPVLTDVMIGENVATGDDEFVTGTGGGMFNADGSCTLNQVTFKNNIAIGGDRCGYGGGMYNVDASAVLNNVMITGNKAIGTFAGGWGGGILCSNSFLTLTNVVIADNTAAGDDYGGCGGGIHSNNNGTVFSRLTNVTICNNTAITGGGMYNNSSSPILNNCIIYGNNTGVLNTDGASAPKYFYSLIQSMPIDPTNHNLGGATNPLFDNPAAGDYRLRFNSPCINQGNNDSIPGGIVTDLAGNNRIAYNIVDMGAYEYKLAVSLGNDTTLCSNGATLYAGNTGSSYFWNTGATTQSIPVTASGTYIVSVSNTWGIVTDTISVEIVPSPVVNLGNDIATGLPSYTLDAGNAGAAYLWSTGATTQTITVHADGVYSVTVTNSFGCSAKDTITVSFQPNGIPTVTAGESRLVITPNPARETVRITTTDGKLLHTKAMLTDAYGRVVRTVMMESKSQQLSLAGLPQGIYILKMENGTTAKMVKE